MISVLLMSFRHFVPAEPKRKRGPDVDIFTACREGGVETVRQHLAAGADVNQADEHGRRPQKRQNLRRLTKIFSLHVAKGALKLSDSIWPPARM